MPVGANDKNHESCKNHEKTSIIPMMSLPKSALSSKGSGYFGLTPMIEVVKGHIEALPLTTFRFITGRMLNWSHKLNVINHVLNQVLYHCDRRTYL